MILFPLLLQAIPAASPDVVVTAQRLHKLRLATSVEGGRLIDCQIRTSSGDAGIDRIACQALHACVDNGVSTSEPLANCIDTRVIAFVRGRADAASGTK